MSVNLPGIERLQGSLGRPQKACMYAAQTVVEARLIKAWNAGANMKGEKLGALSESYKKSPAIERTGRTVATLNATGEFHRSVQARPYKDFAVVGPDASDREGGVSNLELGRHLSDRYRKMFDTSAKDNKDIQIAIGNYLMGRV